ncbi:hypothetical protein ACWDZ8_29010 [Streptomyces sp. NPDC003233]
MPMPEPTHGSNPVRQRERGLRRVATTTRRTATAATAAALLFGAGYAHVLPSVSRLASGAVELPSRSRSQPPANAPASTTRPAQTTTGAS